MANTLKQTLKDAERALADWDRVRAVLPSYSGLILHRLRELRGRLQAEAQRHPEQHLKIASAIAEIETALRDTAGLND